MVVRISDKTQNYSKVTKLLVKPNEMDFLISSLAYNLYHVFQQTILEEKDQTIRMNTYRLKYQKIAVKVIQHARQVTLSFSSAYKNKTQFTQYWNKVLQI